LIIINSISETKVRFNKKLTETINSNESTKQNEPTPTKELEDVDDKQKRESDNEEKKEPNQSKQDLQKEDLAAVAASLTSDNENEKKNLIDDKKPLDDKSNSSLATPNSSPVKKQETIEAKSRSSSPPALHTIKDHEALEKHIMYSLINLLVKFMIYDDQNAVNDDRIMMKQQVKFFA
jgi:hypothetical protein